MNANEVIGAEIFQHQYDDACVGIFNQGIIERKLGLPEKVENKTELILKETKIGYM